MRFKSNKIRVLVTAAAILAFFVVMLGSYTRLTDAGLGCPDWPGCYGHLMPSKLLASQTVDSTKADALKAWTEMAHRYAAGSLALFILLIGVLTLYYRAKKKSVPLLLPLILMFLVLFQAALGMWTVTLKLLPVVVMGHLLGGVLIFSCLMTLCVQWSNVQTALLPQWRNKVFLGVLIIFLQIALGGWVSSNYAGIACIGFPQCNGQWLPTLDFAHAFNFSSSVGMNYQGGVLEHSSRVTIQYVHRLGALFTAVYLLSLSCLLLIKVNNKPIRFLAYLIILLILLQITLGIVNVTYLLPLWVAVAHNGVAALLMATVLMMFALIKKEVHYGY